MRWEVGAGGGGGRLRPLQHVVVALVVVIVSVEVQVRAVIGRGDQRQRPVVLLRVERLLLYAYVVPAKPEEDELLALAS